jgi:malonate transporter
VLAILLITFPFFALVLCGYVAARRGMLPLEAIPGLNAFVLYFALPCMLYRFGASTPVAQLLDIAAVAVYLPCALIMVAATVRFSLNERVRWNDASFRRAGGGLPQHRLHGRAAAGGVAGRGGCGPRHPHHPARPGDHHVAVHRAVAPGRR